MRDTPRPQGTVGDTGSGPPQLRPGRALAHTLGASGSGSPHRSDSRPPQTPRGVRQPDPDGRLGTTPPVPGRPSSFGLLGLLGFFALPAVLFALITWQVVVGGPLARADERLSAAVVQPERIYGFLSDFGNSTVAVPVLAAVLVYVAWRARAARLPRWWLEPAAGAVLMAAVPALVVPLKELTARPGPPTMGPDSGTAFYPSGHTATAVIAYGTATLLLLPWLHGRRSRRALLAACAALNLAVPFGLIRRGYHWPLDVAGSWCLCTMLLAALWLFLSRSSRRSSSRTPGSRSGPS
ncbi:phosphatase PAP2 family protein [Streptomyces sp. SAS_270]